MSDQNPNNQEAHPDYPFNFNEKEIKNITRMPVEEFETLPEEEKKKKMLENPLRMLRIIEEKKRSLELVTEDIRKAVEERKESSIRKAIIASGINLSENEIERRISYALWYNK